MAKTKTEFQTNYGRLKAWRDRLRGGPRMTKKRDTPYMAPFSEKAAKGPKPKEEEEQ